MRIVMRSNLTPLAVVLLCFLNGCDAGAERFEPNVLYAERMKIESEQDQQVAIDNVQAILERLFGTADEPLWPECITSDVTLAETVSLARLRRAAGPVSSDEQGTHFGLYRKHCIACHGTSGDGMGATSRLLNPYPRDFRLGKFKIKSTPLGSKPTRDDLRGVLLQGIPGTAMASFNLLSDDDIEALVDYTIYLSVRGEVERQLLNEAALDLDYAGGDRLVNFEQEQAEPDDFGTDWQGVERTVERAVAKWSEAADKVPGVVGPPADFPIYGQVSNSDPSATDRLRTSIANGDALFHGPVASCSKCHGLTAMGDGQANDYDDWTKDWSVQAGLDPADRTSIRPMLELGALKPRHILPRNLRSGVFRGGDRPIDLYYRIVHGIEGTPMPAAALKPDNPQGLSEEEVWDLVNYLLSLPDEPLSLRAPEKSL